MSESENFQQTESNTNDEYGEYANDGAEDLDFNSTSTNSTDTKEVKEKNMLERYPKTTFLIISLIGVGLFAMYMRWEEEQKKKKPEGVKEVNNTGWSKDNSPEDWKKSGNEAFKEKRYEDAISDYSVAISLSKEKPSAVYYVNRANAYYEIKKYNEAIDDCNKAYEIDKDYAKQYWRVANCLFKIGQYEGALNVINNASKLPAFKDQSETSAFGQFWKQCEEAVE